ncbi:uncharacterized protein LOC109512975 [Hippocampus comes]|uniref:uncharacterized protein LOC109512975 n=1 Tax=Hippocampus comes TaxID=109280 RepID=UPI00094F05D4|nr:PREDICTED: uncharacterized protein LOC109512975 [Hippocampus comes]
MDGVDNNYIWQRRVFHGMRNQRGEVPFPESAKIGVEFNATVERWTKLDTSLLTHGVLMEICNFARTVATAEKYFLFEVMAFNFDLGLDTADHKLCYQYAARIHGKIKNKKVKPQHLKDIFPLPDVSVLKAYVDKTTSQSQIPLNNFFSILAPPHLSEEQPAEGAVVPKKGQETTLHKANPYPICQELGVSLAVDPSKSGHRKFHLDLLTNGLMLELLDFSRVLSSTANRIGNTLLEQNFGIQVSQIPRVMFQKRKALDYTRADARIKRSLQCTIGDATEELLADSYMCPLDSEAETQSSVAVNEDDGQVPVTATRTDTQSSIGERSDEGALDGDARRKLWLLRGVCSTRILTTQKAKSQFESCREIGLDFDVGSGAKQALPLHLLTNGVLMEVQQFAMALNKGSGSFLSDILERNFHVVPQEEHSTQTLVGDLITKWKALLAHPDKAQFEFLNGSLHLPHIYDGGKEVESTKCASSSSDMDPYPFCKRIGLDFWATDGVKLPLSALTVGALLEMFQFVDSLRGTTTELVKDILEHNFNLDLRSGESEAAAAFQKWCAGVVQKWPSVGKWFVRRPNALPRDLWLSTPVFTQIESEDRGAGIPSNQETNVTAIQFNDFGACKQIGLDLDVGSKWGAKSKLSLQQLTRGVLLEVHRYVRQNRLRYVPSLFQILDYNFELGYHNSHKVEFAWSVASQVLAMARKSNRNDNYLNTVFELPFQLPPSSPSRCKDEPEEELLHQQDPGDQDIVFVQKLQPVDIEVEIE